MRRTIMRVKNDPRKVSAFRPQFLLVGHDDRLYITINKKLMSFQFQTLSALCSLRKQIISEKRIRSIQGRVYFKKLKIRIFDVITIIPNMRIRECKNFENKSGIYFSFRYLFSDVARTAAATIASLFSHLGSI